MDNGGAFTDRLLDLVSLDGDAQALDVGCGPGDVALRVARRLNGRGRVLGIDPNEAAVVKATERARAEGVANAEFRVAAIGDLGDLGGSMDLVTCRRVLMYLPDQIGAATALRRTLKLGGRLVVQEHDASLMGASAPMPLHERARGWIWDTVRAEGANTSTGFDLYRILTAAGFDTDTVLAEAVVETPAQAAPTAEIVRLMTPRIVAAGVATAEEMAVETLAARLDEERGASAATFVGEMMFGAVATAPS